MSLVFAIERLPSIWPQIMALASAHWMETEGYRHGQKFAPDAARYFAFNEMPVGNLSFYTMFTARHDGDLVGYSGNYLSRSMHTQLLLCTEDTYFLTREFRRGRNALEFYKFIEERCLENGVVEMGMTAKKSNNVGRILEYLGFENISANYSKHLSYHQSPVQQRAPDPGCADSAMSQNLMEPDCDQEQKAA